MKKSIYSLIILAIIAFSSCSKENTYDETRTDAQLIEAIQTADKQSITNDELPAHSMSVLNINYTESYTEASKIAPGLGYEVDMRREKGSYMGECSQVYFDLNGRKLNNEKKGDWGKDGIDLKECFKIIYPVTFIMPDGSNISGDDEEQLWMIVKNWYGSNPDSKAKPEFQYPIEIEYDDGIIKILESNDDLDYAYMVCKGEVWEKKECFKMVYPVTYTMPDGSILTGYDEELLWDSIKSWYNANPDTDDKPVLQYPIEIEFDDDSILIINSENEMDDAYMACK